jgi:short-subunit dehydrogenase involved in D-alanine esterification of teichoic acids
VASGAKVAVCEINASALDATAKVIPCLKTVVSDASKRDDIERMVAASDETLGGFRCAGE